MPFGTHWWDLVPIVVLALLIFGPKRLPQMGSSIGETIKEFRKSMKEATQPTPAAALPAAQPETLAPTQPAAPEAIADATVESKGE